MQHTKFNPYVGILYGLKAFVAAVLGGIGNIPGAVLGGLIMGVAETMVVAYGPSIGIPEHLPGRRRLFPADPHPAGAPVGPAGPRRAGESVGEPSDANSCAPCSAPVACGRRPPCRQRLGGRPVMHPDAANFYGMDRYKET